MLEGQDLYSIVTIMTIHDIAIITGGIYCWTACAKETQNISTRLGLRGLLSEIALQIKCTDVQ